VFLVRRLKLQPGWAVVAASFAVMFGAWNPHAGFGVFLPVLSREFGWSRGAISLAASLNLFIGGTLAFWVGAASDRYGARRVLALSALLAGTCYLFASTINALWHFYLLQGVLLGICMSGMYLVPTATVARWFAERRGLALGIVLAGLNLAYVVGGPLSAFFINTFGWRTTYLLLGGLVWSVAVPASLFMREPPSGGGFQAQTARAVPGATSTLRSPLSFAMAEATFREALVDRRLWFLAATWFLQGFVNMMVAIHMVPHVTDRGATLESASLALTIYGISSIGGRVLFGAAADRVGTRPTFWFCLALQLLALTSVLIGPSLRVLYFLIMWFGLAAAGGDTAVVKAAPEVFGVRAIGAIMGILSLGWRCGAALGPAAAGFIYDATGSYTFAFSLASVGLMLSLALFTLGMSPPRPRADSAR
jgi:MFS family permease